ncbi:MAG: hypothetical protein QM638_14540 [Nocardioides sp.]|uniref:shikimate dehydrogenase family protein n=1 Tax=Nocardioides sp. TaxID=35761 RepID=UPI0039E34F36
MIEHGRMGFVGVDTARSSIQRVFPLWADHLGLPTRELRGFDLPLGAPDAAYRDVVEAIRDDPGQAGALVTTHKMRLHQAAHDLFDHLDDFARACHEVSSISKRDGALHGHAKDPITAGLALEAIVAEDYFARTGAEVVVLGSGGSGIALSWYLAGRSDRPSRVRLVGLGAASIEQARRIHARGGLPVELFDYHVLDPAAAVADATAQVEAATPGAVVVNATGMGKDRPGSPLSVDAVFPADAVVWEFNYRGSLEFLRQARAQREQRNLTVSDGWTYFVHGWSQVVAEVFDLTLTDRTVEELSAIAETVR